MAGRSRTKSFWKVLFTASSPVPYVRRLFLRYTSEIRGLAVPLTRLEQNLPKICSQIEHRYLASSSILEPLTEASGSFVAESAELLRLTIGEAEGGSLTTGISSILSKPLLQLENWRQEVTESLRHLARCRELFVQLGASEQALQSAVAALPHLMVMFRVESARLDGGAGEVFKGLTDQIAGIGVDVRQSFSEQFEIIRNTLGAFDRSIAQLSSQSEMIRLDSTEQKRRTGAAQASFQVQLADNQRREEQLKLISRAVSHGTSEIVVALQAQDAVSQRLGHAGEGIAEACELLPKAQSHRARTGDAEIEERVFYLLSLQRTQVEDVHTQLEASEDAIGSAVEEITSQTQFVGAECTLLKDFQEIVASAHKSVALSLTMLQDARTLIECVAGSSREFYQALSPMGELAAGLSGDLDSLAHKMRLIALNAQVQAIQIEGGASLEVLAAHVAELSAETSQLATSIGECLVLLTSNLSRMADVFGSLTTGCEGTLDELRHDASAHEAKLHGFRERADKRLAAVDMALRDIRSCTDLLSEQTEHRRGALESIADATLVIDQAATLLRKVVGPIRHGHFAHLGEDRYCMASEREAHNRTLGALAQAASGDSGEQPVLALDTHNQTLHSVELF